MTPGSELTAREAEQAAELEALEARGRELADKLKGDISADEIALPLIKCCQSLTKEVKAKKAEEGDFVNTVTGTNYGKSFELVIAGRFKGRFYSDDDSGRAFVAANQDIVPDNWPDKYKGQRFADLIDAEEQFKAAVDEGELQWGSGPPISTTHNFVGYIAGQPDVPVRVSLMRSSAPAATTINTLLKMFDQPWSNTIVFQSEDATDSKQRAYAKVTVAEGEATTTADKIAAINLAGELETAKLTLVGDDTPDEKPAKPAEAEGALAVD